MNNKLFIPSCHKFITKKDGTANFQRIYGVLKSAYSTKYPNDTLSSEEVFDFLKLNQIVPHDFPHQDMDFDYQELCFSIITQYKCNSICQLCPYSSLYKNIYENEESILLSYALNSWDHLNSLKKAGLTCRHFRSMIPVSDKSKVLVVPLNRLAYEYLETVPSSANDLLSIDHKIMTALKQNNKNKLSNADFEIMHKYLTNLTRFDSKKISDENVADIMKRCFQLEYTKKVASNSATAAKPSISTAPPIEGLLAGKSQEHISKKLSKTPEKGKSSKYPVKQPTSAPKEYPQDIKEVPSKPELKSVSTPSKKQPNPSLKKDSKILSVYNCQNTPELVLSVPTPLKRLPKTWALSAQELSAAHIIDLEIVEALRIELFLFDLLQTPILPAEIVEIKNEYWFLMYVKEQFYIFHADNLALFKHILPYISRSKVRKIICYEPYLLYYFLFKHNLYYVSIFSLRLTADICLQIHNWGIFIESLLNTLIHIHTKGSILDILPAYYQTYRILDKKLEKIDTTQQDMLFHKMCLARAIGKFFIPSNYYFSENYAFLEETPEDYIFTYDGTQKMQDPYYSIRYVFSWDAEELFPAKSLAIWFIKNRLLETHKITILAVKENQITFAITNEEYSFLCSIVNQAIGQYVILNETPSVSIDEIILNDKIL